MSRKGRKVSGKRALCQLKLKPKSRKNEGGRKKGGSSKKKKEREDKKGETRNRQGREGVVPRDAPRG